MMSNYINDRIIKNIFFNYFIMTMILSIIIIRYFLSVRNYVENKRQEYIITIYYNQALTVD
jgi:hypothetical protein